MHRTALLSTMALALASRAAAQGIDSEDIAPNCATVCSNIVTVSDSCERQFDDVQNEDQQELDCICNAQGLDQQIPECEACQRQYYSQDEDYNDIQQLLNRCGFSSMSGTGTMTSMGSAPTGAAGGGMTTVITSTYTDTDNDDDDNDIDLEVTTITSVMPTDATTTGAGTTDNNLATATDAAGSAGASATEVAGSATSGASDAVGSATDAAGSVAEQSGNFAPAVTAAPVLAMAGVAAAVFGL